jgi:hypothetical protein
LTKVSFNSGGEQRWESGNPYCFFNVSDSAGRRCFSHPLIILNKIICNFPKDIAPTDSLQYLLLFLLAISSVAEASNKNGEI